MSKNRNKNRRSSVSMTTSRAVLERFEGPIPPPAVMEGYKSIDPKLPTMLMEMAIEEQAHRHHMEKKKVEVVEQKFGNQATAQHCDFKFGTRGQWLTFFLAIIFLTVIVFLGLHGMAWHGMETAICYGFGAGGFVVIFSFLAPRFFAKSQKEKQDS